MPGLRLSNVPATDTALKLLAVAVLMFAFVFVVMVPLYNVLCDALGINGKTSGQAYTSAPIAVDTSRQVTVQFVAVNNDDMPWSFAPDARVMRVHPGQQTASFSTPQTRPARTWSPRRFPAFHPAGPRRISTKRNVSVLISRRWPVTPPQIWLCSLLLIRICPTIFTPSRFPTPCSISRARRRTVWLRCRSGLLGDSYGERYHHRPGL